MACVTDWLTMENTIEQISEIVLRAEAVLITAGAGMSVDSGLPDYRGVEGFWRAYPHAEKLGLKLEELDTPSMFIKNPEHIYGFYAHRLKLYRNALPHHGYKILLDIAQSKGEDNFFVYTSNVDGQFLKAGFDEDKLYECHGSIHHWQCLNGCSGDIWSADNHHIDFNENTLLASEPLPKCPHCGSNARPNIYMFSDFNWNSRRSSAQMRKYKDWLHDKRDSKQSIVVIEIGAGKAIPTIRSDSEIISIEDGNTLIRINTKDCDVMRKKNIGISGTALDVLSALGISMGLGKL
jgi:NAD-dependent SIR2 family protein deacetylase